MSKVETIIRTVFVCCTDLKSLDYLKIRYVDFGVLGQMEVLLSHTHSFLEQILVHSNFILLWHQHLDATVNKAFRACTKPFYQNYYVVSKYIQDLLLKKRISKYYS